MNDVELHQFRNHTLVRFRCMVQDMFDPEYYLGLYEVRNKSTNETSLRCGKYRDTVESKVTCFFCIDIYYVVTNITYKLLLCVYHTYMFGLIFWN